jgi:type IV secretion system protein VirB9
MKRTGLACFILALNLSTASAELVAQPGRSDPRVRNVPYSAEQVVVVTGTYGLITTILFGADEEILTVTAGDTISWQIVVAANKKALTLKPIEKDAPTNMSVITSKRTYSFELQVNTTNSKREQTYKVKFTYPEEAGLRGTAEMRRQAEEATKSPNLKNIRRDKVNFDYGFKGGDGAKPTWVFDDGIKTFMKFTGDVPAIFTVDGKRRESLINYRREGDYIVVDSVARQWTLRYGTETETCLFNLRTAPADVPAPIEGAVAPRRIGAGTPSQSSSNQSVR